MAGRQKNALAGRCTIWFFDESGATLTPLVAKTWAPRGRTPTLPHNFGRWDKVSMASVVGTTRKLYFRLLVKDAFRRTDVASFVRDWLRHVPGDVVLFWDRANQHKGPEIDRVLRDHPRLRIEPLPPYGFDFNADDGVWDHVKWIQLPNFTPRDVGEQVRGYRRALRRLQRRPDLIASFFERTALPRRDIRMLLDQSRNP